MIASLLLAVATATPAAPVTEVSMRRLDDDRFRLVVVYAKRGEARARTALLEAAAQICQGKGRPVGAGRLFLDKVARGDRAARKRGSHALSEEYRCVPEPASASR
jgi:hypothetical protein